MKKWIPAALFLLCAVLTGCENAPENTTAKTAPLETTTAETTTQAADTEPTSDSAASETTTVVHTPFPQDSEMTTLPLFARFDFGTKTYAEQAGLTSHDYIVGALSYEKDAIDVTFTEDSILLTARKNGTFSSAGDIATTEDSLYFHRGTATCYYPMNEFSLNFDNLTTYDFEDELRSGYGTFAGFPFTFGTFGDKSAWRGYHQYMKIRIKNPTENDKIAVQFNNSAAYASTQFMVMSVGAKKDSFETYIYDLCYAASYASGKGVPLAGQAPGNNWTWKQNTPVTGLRFHLLGATCSYANAYLNNVFSEGESADDADRYAEYFQRLDSRALIRQGETVEIDYIVFGSTPHELQAYHSYAESSLLAERG